MNPLVGALLFLALAFLLWFAERWREVDSDVREFEERR